MSLMIHRVRCGCRRSAAVAVAAGDGNMAAGSAVARSLAGARMVLSAATLAFALTLKGKALSPSAASFETRVTLLLVRCLCQCRRTHMSVEAMPLLI